ncbi:MAG: ATP-binding protein [Oligoflexia bacterium]|nr:ATP-binding protein [Oligoflexia bacterium]
MKQRYISASVKADLKKKMVFVGGPRQSGKTTFSKQLLLEHYKSKEQQESRYLNWDFTSDRDRVLKGQIPTEAGLLVLDEIHKYSKWRNLVKGIFDKFRDKLQILVTGSARLDHYRRGGDSLQGRYHYYRLYPLSLKEIGTPNQDILIALLNLSGFPEPFFSGSENEARRWSREYRARVMKEEVSSIEMIKDLSTLELLATRLPALVGSPLSLNSLREDLSISQPTIARWVEILERFYFIFRLSPFGGPKIRAVKKEQKHYHFDWTQIEELGPRFENLIAFHLLKWCHYIEDTQGFDMELRYFRDVDGREVDFVVVKNKKPLFFIEAKYSDKDISPSLSYLKKKYPSVQATQVLFTEGIDFKTLEDIRVCSAARFLMEFV